MTTVQVFNLAFDAWSILFCIILIIGSFLSRFYDPKRSWLLFAILLTDAFLNAAEIVAYCFRGDVSQLGFYLVRISNFCVFLSYHLLLLFLALFLFRTIEMLGGRIGTTFKRVVIAAIAIGAALLVLSRFVGFYYAFDDQNRYYRLDNHWIMLAIELSVLALLAVVTIRNWGILSTLERISFSMFEFLPLVAGVAQVFVYGISLTTFANTLSIVMIFIAYQVGYSRHMLQIERTMLDEVINALAQAVDAKDPYTNGHSNRVAKYSRMIAERMGLDKREVDRIWRMAVLHDVGKIGVPDYVLNKKGKLTPEEYRIVQEHTERGDAILAGISTMPQLHAGARWHHERIDGKGYPDGLAGDQIPLEARIIGVADGYDAMTSDRVYRQHLPQDVVRCEIEDNMGTQFDAEVARAMLEIMDEDPDYQLHG